MRKGKVKWLRLLEASNCFAAGRIRGKKLMKGGFSGSQTA
jgi:hypothetical protein